TGHDKGGVEGRGRGIRLQHLVPIPSGPDLASINRAFLERLDAKMSPEARQRFDAERPAMLPLAAQPFQSAGVQLVSASRRALVRIEGAYYSVWSRWTELELTAYVSPSHVEIVGPDARVIHPRKRFGERSVDYRHYVRELAKKPQAVRQVADEL